MVVTSFAVWGIIRQTPGDYSITTNPRSESKLETESSHQVNEPESDVLQHSNLESEPKETTANQLGIVFKDLQFPDYWLDPPYLEDYEMFIGDARNGDTDAAIIVWSILENCKYDFGSQQDVDSAIDSMKQTHSLQLPEMDAPQPLGDPDKSIPVFEKMLNETHQNCQGISSDMRNERHELIKKAALESKSPAAMNLYSKQVADYEQGVELDTERWVGGEAVALLDLAKRFTKSYESGEIADNDFKAYVYLLAFQRIYEEQLGEGTQRPKILPSVSKLLESAKIHLYPYELESAEREAEELIRSNKSCCYRF